MEAWTCSNERRLTESTRQRPRSRPILCVAAAATGDCGFCEREVPGELHLEATDDLGEAADWFNDNWWMEALERWQDHPLAVHILPTPQALLHPVVVHHIEMLYRVAPRWRRIGHCYVDDVVADEDIRYLAISSYDELRVIDSFRPGTGKSDSELREVKVEKLIGRVRRVQASVGATRPLLIRVPPAGAPVSGRMSPGAGACPAEPTAATPAKVHTTS